MIALALLSADSLEWEVGRRRQGLQLTYAKYPGDVSEPPDLTAVTFQMFHDKMFITRMNRK